MKTICITPCLGRRLIFFFSLKNINADGMDFLENIYSVQRFPGTQRQISKIVLYDVFFSRLLTVESVAGSIPANPLPTLSTQGFTLRFGRILSSLFWFRFVNCSCCVISSLAQTSISVMPVLARRHGLFLSCLVPESVMMRSRMFCWIHGVDDRAKAMRRGAAKRAMFTYAKASV